MIERLQQSITEIETETTETQKKKNAPLQNTVWGGCSRWFPEEEGGKGGFITNTLEGSGTGVLRTTGEKLGNKFGRFRIEKTRGYCLSTSMHQPLRIKPAPSTACPFVPPNCTRSRFHCELRPVLNVQEAPGHS